MESVNVWLTIAESDLKAARILYASDNFRTSYLMFQQAVEKANKAFGLMTHAVKESDIRKDIGHNSLKVHKKIAEQNLAQMISTTEFLSRQNFVKAGSFFSLPDLTAAKENIDEHDSFVKDLNNSDLLKIKTDKLKKLIGIIDKIDKINIKLTSKDKHRSNTLISGLIGELKSKNIKNAKESIHELEAIVTIPEKGAEFFEILELVLNYIVDIFFVTTVLYINGIITLNHVSWTRYPNTNFDPMKVYTKSLSLVKHQQYFMDALEEAILIIRRIFNEKLFEE